MDQKPSKSNFKRVNRKKEDEMVVSYQTNGSQSVLEELYQLREPTLKVWAKKFSYLKMEEEDLFAETVSIWLKCINSYEYEPQQRILKTKDGHILYDEQGNAQTQWKRTPFNTFLFTSLRNHLRNLYKRNYSKKKTDDNGNSIDLNLISIDCEHEDGDSNKLSSLKNTLVGKDSLPSEVALVRDLVDDIADGDKDVHYVLKKFVSDCHYKKIASACQYDEGRVAVDNKDADIFINNIGSKDARDKVIEMIDGSNRYAKGYYLLNFKFNKENNTVSFEVKRKDTSVLRKTIRVLKKYREKIISV